jgi:hypothetical protein
VRWIDAAGPITRMEHVEPVGDFALMDHPRPSAGRSSKAVALESPIVVTAVAKEFPALIRFADDDASKKLRLEFGRTE